jgi:hypothetical protein
MYIINENLLEEALGLKGDQDQLPEGHLAPNLTRENSGRANKKRLV